MASPQHTLDTVTLPLMATWDKTTRTRILRILIHTVVWMGIVMVPMIFTPPGVSSSITRIDTISFVKRDILFTIMLMCIFYVNMHVFIPRFLAKKRFNSYILFIVFVFSGSFLLAYSITLLFPVEPHAFIPPISTRIFMGALAVTMVLFVSTGITITSDWLQNEQTKREIEAERNAAELAFLKSQVSPHFLFNTLNNIYSLTLIKPASAADSVLKLSNLMRYLLHSSSSAVVPLADEIAYLNDFIALQQLRITPNTRISFHLGENISGYAIAPMLFIPFVENAFKHGISPSQASEIIIQLFIEKENLYFIVENSIFEAAFHSDSGIGLQNIRRRLDLLYPQQYSLDVSPTPTRFRVALQLPLRALHR